MNKLTRKPPRAGLRSRGEGEIGFAIGSSALGSLLVARSERGICAILIGDEDEALVRDLQRRFARFSLGRDDRALAPLLDQVRSVLAAPERAHELPLDPRGTAFQLRVWQALREVPAGQTVSYAELARRIGAPAAVRAVGSACAANALAVAIPCHRALRSDGRLSGYRWGVERKRALLDREARR
jgi:AraC family transcriptional regulator of adaptative response/methylated-DNA-[protein]-cysteine methyltransferase